LYEVVAVIHPLVVSNQAHAASNPGKAKEKEKINGARLLGIFLVFLRERKKTKLIRNLSRSTFLGSSWGSWLAIDVCAATR
jgi:hypothetical protein